MKTLPGSESMRYVMEIYMFFNTQFLFWSPFIYWSFMYL